MNKASGRNGIPTELFQILKDDAVNVLHYAGTFEKLSSGHRTGKGQFSFQSQKGQCQRMLKLLYNCAHFACLACCDSWGCKELDMTEWLN